MEFGWHLPNYGPLATRQHLVRAATEAEALGFDAVFVSDHVVLPFESATPYGGSGARAFPMPSTAPFLEPLTALTLLAGVTSRVRLGTTVLVLPHRHPVLAAKTIATLDELSEGRVILGVGVGWWREEIEALGAPYARRGAWSDEALDVMQRCWTDERSAYAGEFFRFDALGCFPKPRQRPHPPIWVGGRTAAAFRRVARFGDGFHAAFAPPAELEGQIAAVHQALRAARRDPATLTLSVRAAYVIRQTAKPDEQTGLVGTVESIVENLARYRALGVHHVVLEPRMRDIDDHLALMRRFATEIRPALDATAAAR